MQRSKCEFYAETQAKAEAKLNEWKKQNARAVSIIAQIIETHSAGSDASVIRVEYENNDKAKGRRRPLIEYQSVCAQCRADIIAPEWSEHLSDYVFGIIGRAMPAGSDLRIPFTYRGVRWRTCHRG